MALTANVHIGVAARGDKTVLKQVFCTPPFKVADVTEDKRQRQLQLMLMSSSPGILDGDAYHLSIDLGQGANLRLETQSYQRIFQMQNSAIQTFEVTMAPHSSFTYLPLPVVPHKQSSLIAKNKIVLAEGCTLLWSEVISCGRKLNNEVFQFRRYHSLTEIFLKEKLVVKENLLLQPGIVKLDAIGQMEGYTHQATLLYLNEKKEMAPLLSVLAEKLEGEDGIAVGVTALPVNGIMVRLLGHKAEQLFQLLQQAAAIICSFKPSGFPKTEAYV